MRCKIETHLLFHLSVELERLDSCRYRLNQHLSMLERSLPTVGHYHFREPAVSKVSPQGTFCMNTQLSTGTLASIFRPRYIRWQKPTSLVCCTSTPSKNLEPLHKVLFGEVDPGLAIVESSTTILWVTESSSSRLLARTRSLPSLFVICLLLVLRVSNTKFAHIYEGNSITTQRRWPVSFYRHLELRLQPAAGSTYTSPVVPTQRMHSASALRLRLSCCCMVFHCVRLGSNANTQRTDFRSPKSEFFTLWAVSRTYPIQLSCPDLCDCGPGGISSEDLPS